MFTLGLAASQKATAQERGRVGVSETSLDSIARQVEFMSPRSGPPGTVVTLRSTNMPALTPVRIGVRALRFGFEAGDEVTIEGTLPDAAICMQGTTIQVARIRAGRATFGPSMGIR